MIQIYNYITPLYLFIPFSMDAASIYYHTISYQQYIKVTFPNILNNNYLFSIIIHIVKV